VGAKSYDVKDRNAAHSQEEREPEAIMDDIRHTRAEMSQTINEIQERLDPQRLRNQAQGALHDATIGRAKDMADNVTDRAKGAGTSFVDTVRENPIPAAMVALGLGWLWRQRSSSRETIYRRQPYTLYDEERYPEGRTTGTPITERQRTRTYGAPTTGQQQGRPYEVAGKTQQRAGQMAGRAQQQAGEMADRGRHKAEEMVEQGRHRAEDVVEQGRHRAEDMVEQGRHRAEEMVERGQQRAGEFVERGQEQVQHVAEEAQHRVSQARHRFEDMIEENPLAVGAIALATGVAIGLAIPETRQEHQVLGEARDTLLDRAQQSAEETMEKAQHVAEEAEKAAKEQARKENLTQQ
jgi:ElaB/YqjD/DUF883 family membrane-anchored ribosome-binding protein